MKVEMKDSGIPWIGEIPKDWEISKVKRIMRNKSVRNYPNEMVLSLYREYGVIPKDSRDDNHNVTSEDTTNYKFVEVGDFVINKMKAWQGSMGLSDYRGIISPAYYVCKFVDNENFKKYIHHLLRNETYKPEYMRLSTGLRVGQWDLGIDDFLNIPIILPPTDIQFKIVSFLDDKCADIDQLIALQQQMIDELKAYKQSVITEAVCKGLDKSVPMKDSGIEWIGEVPEGWEIKRLKNIGYLYGGITGKSGDDFSVSETDNFNYYIPFTNIYRNIEIDISNFPKVKTTENEKQNYVLNGDLLFLMSSEDFEGIGKVAILKEKFEDNLLLNSFCKGFRITDQEYYPEYVNYYLLSSNIRELIKVEAKGFIRINLRMDKVANLPLIAPNYEEQLEIVKYINSKIMKIDNLISIKQQKIEELKDYKKSMIYEYITGKKQVPN